MYNFLNNFINVNEKNSVANKVRRENFNHFKNLVSSFNRKVKVLDIGGTQEYWEMMEYTDPNLIEVILINITENKVTLPNFMAIQMDATDLDLLEFDCDIVFSHSLIEHVDHEIFATIVRCFNRYYFIQTPNKNVPMEPHFLIPLFQFMPLWLKKLVLKSIKSPIINEVEDINLLNKRELKKLFPYSEIYGGKILGMTQSFIVMRRII